MHQNDADLITATLSSWTLWVECPSSRLNCDHTVLFFRLRHQNCVDKMPEMELPSSICGRKSRHTYDLFTKREGKQNSSGLFVYFLAYFSTVESHRKVNKSAEQSWWAMVDFGLFSGPGRVYKIIHFSRVFFTSGYTIWCFSMKSQRLKRTSLKFCVWSFHPMNQVWMSTQGILS